MAKKKRRQRDKRTGAADHKRPTKGTTKSTSAGRESKSRIIPAAITGAALFAVLAGVYIVQPLLTPVSDEELNAPSGMKPTRFFKSGKLTIAWDPISPEALNLVSTKSSSNIAPDDYVGPSKCVECHQEKHQDWAKHPHRWMNALADAETVLGDFSGEATIEYRGGLGTFYQVGTEYRMKFERDDLVREYRITQTIGSRFHQYFVGTGIKGPESEDHPYFREEFVLPFGYWFARKQWVPIVHVTEELPDSHRWEIVEDLTPPAPDADSPEEVSSARGVALPGQKLGLIYAHGCNYCHTTFPLGDMFVRMPYLTGQSLTEEAYFELSEYVADSHPTQWDGSKSAEEFSSEALEAMTSEFIAFDARDKAATLGISCEACHLGCREHLQEPEQRKPAFTPQHPNFHTASAVEEGRSAENLNSVCGRCHAGNRPKYAAGMATWNSTEYSDAMRGSCYSQLTCVQCHDPHKATGQVWSKTPEEDDESCLVCHEQFRRREIRQSHTHHAPGSSGDHCMDCHMPKINEGLQDVVRTHTIFSPTQPDMIEANQPNACNLCHLDESIDWTLGKLSEWYGKEYDIEAINQNYVDRTSPVGVGWMRQDHQATRLVAADALGRSEVPWALEELIPSLDDPYMINRHFSQKAVEKLLKVDLAQQFGYWYFQLTEERQPKIEKLREFLRRQ